METNDCEAYKAYVNMRLDALTPIFAKVAMGDFSSNIKIPDGNDNFTRFYVGIQVMLEVIRSQIQSLTSFNQDLEDKVKDRTSKLEETNTELKKVNEFMVGRELRIVELKNEKKELLQQIETLKEELARYKTLQGTVK